jgi:hypothetical protein
MESDGAGRHGRHGRPMGEAAGRRQGNRERRRQFRRSIPAPRLVGSLQIHAPPRRARTPSLQPGGGRSGRLHLHSGRSAGPLRPQTAASGCSPPHLSVTQLPSATEVQLPPVGTSTQRLARAHGRTRRRLQTAAPPERADNGPGTAPRFTGSRHAPGGTAELFPESSPPRQSRPRRQPRRLSGPPRSSRSPVRAPPKSPASN